jgi:ferredoxin-NADP reductase
VQPAARLQWQTAVIERIEPKTARVTSFFLQAPLESHLAGQHVDVRLTAPDGYQAQRSYSIASRPGDPLIELAIERLEDGEVSPYFHEVARPGDGIEVRGPIGGHFIWRVEDGGPLLLIAGGSGIAPLMAIARHRAAVLAGIPALLVYSARSWGELIFRDELLELDACQPGFSFVATTTRGPPHRGQDFARRLDRSLIRAILVHWHQTPRHVYVCGSNMFVESVTQELLHEAVPAERIRVERFGGSG